MTTLLTREQRAWLRDLGSLVEGTPGDLVLEDAETPDGNGARDIRRLRDRPEGENTAAFAPSLLDLAPAILNEIQKLGGGRRICAVRVVNKTRRVIRRGNAKHDGGSFKSLPPDSIAPDGHADFMAASPEPLPVINVPPEGCIGRMDWLLDGELSWFIEWRNPVAGSVKSDTSLTDTGSASRFSVDNVNTGGNTAEFRFTVFELGGSPPTPPNPNPNPNPNPQPVDAIASSCLIQIQNKTQQKLTLRAAKHERGDFMVRPKTTIEPDDVDDAIVSIETPRAPDEGCKGFIEYSIGEPSVGTWRVEWDNPEGQKNTADAPLSPASKTFDSLALISQGDENVRVNFLLRETGGGDPTPVPPNPLPVPPVPVPPTPNQIPKTRQPTLRQGDKSADGWVEYLQQRLNDLINAGLKVDGDFGRATLKAVHAFQQARGLQNDGTVGNQTWAALRDATPEGPSTDGRKPHSFVEKGPEARWNDEKERAVYITALDEMLLFLVSVGTQPIDAFNVEVTVTAPGMPAATRSFPIGKPDKETGTGSGSFHSLKMNQFRKLFPAKNPKAKITDYVIVATLPQELGGEGWTGAIVEG